MTGTPPPFFIVGAPRSGTTMLRLMLNAHPGACVPGESHFVLEISRDMNDQFDPDAAWAALLEHGRYREWDLDDDEVKAAIDAQTPDWHGFFTAVYDVCARTNGAARWGDKTPVYARDLTRLHRIFPDAVVIHIVRDGRDVVCSLRSVAWFSDDVIDCADWWRDTVMRADTEGTTCFGDRYRMIRYEDLVADPESVLRELCDSLALTYNDAMLRFHEEADQHIAPERRVWHERTTEKVTNAAIGRYRQELTARELEVVELVCGDTLARFGYELESSPGLGARLDVRLRRCAGALGLRRSTSYRGFAGHASVDDSERSS